MGRLEKCGGIGSNPLVWVDKRGPIALAIRDEETQV
jgi:hypothetical protein